MNWTKLTRLTPSETLLIDVEAAMTYCRATEDDEELITGLIEAATAFICGPTGIGTALLTEEWVLSLNDFPSCETLDLCPVQSVDTITYLDVDGVTQVVDPATYYVDVDQRPAIVAFNERPKVKSIPGAVKIIFTAGYGDTPSMVPADLRHAALWLVANWYENRGDDASKSVIPATVDRVLNKYRSF